jgi:hypothetical protein
MKPKYHYKPEGHEFLPDEVTEFFFNLPYPSNRSTFLGLILPLTEINTGKCFWGKVWQANKVQTSATCELIV